MKKNILISLIGLFITQFGNSQCVIKGSVKIEENTILSSGYILINDDQASLINDGEVYLAASLENKGNINYNQDSGYFRFISDQEQYIKTLSNGNTNFQNVEFNNTSNINLNVTNSFTINGLAYFNNGILDNLVANSEILFHSNAEAFNASNYSFIKGKVQKEGLDFFYYPVGSSAYRPFISKLPNVTSFLEVQYNLSNSDFLYPHNLKNDEIVSINTKEYWEVFNLNENILAEGGFKVDTYFLSPDVNNHLYGTVKAILHFDTSLNKWVSKAGELNNDIIYNSQLMLTSGAYTLGRIKSKEQEDLDLFIFNAISPNGNNLNDYLKIRGVENYPNNKLQIFNRYGQKLFSTKRYGENGNLWYGTSNNQKLPTGTYFYTFSFVIENGQSIEKTGYLYIN